MPRYITHPDLAVVVWLMTEAVINHLDTRLDDLMAAVQVEQDTLDTLGASFEALATGVANLPAAGEPLAQANLDALNQALADGQAALQAHQASATPVDGGAAAPADGGAGAADPTAPAVGDGTDVPDATGGPVVADGVDPNATP